MAGKTVSAYSDLVVVGVATSYKFEDKTFDGKKFTTHDVVVHVLPGQTNLDGVKTPAPVTVVAGVARLPVQHTVGKDVVLKTLPQPDTDEHRFRPLTPGTPMYISAGARLAGFVPGCVCTIKGLRAVGMWKWRKDTKDEQKRAEGVAEFAYYRVDIKAREVSVTRYRGKAIVRPNGVLRSITDFAPAPLPRFDERVDMTFGVNGLAGSPLEIVRTSMTFIVTRQDKPKLAMTFTVRHQTDDKLVEMQIDLMNPAGDLGISDEGAKEFGAGWTQFWTALLGGPFGVTGVNDANESATLTFGALSEAEATIYRVKFARLYVDPEHLAKVLAPLTVDEALAAYDDPKTAWLNTDKSVAQQIENGPVALVVCRAPATREALAKAKRIFAVLPDAGPASYRAAGDKEAPVLQMLRDVAAAPNRLKAIAAGEPIAALVVLPDAADESTQRQLAFIDTMITTFDRTMHATKGAKRAADTSEPAAKAARVDAE